MSDRRCAHCSGPIEAHGRGTSVKGRPPKFCSARCKEAARAVVQKAERKVAREGRACLYCGGPVDPSKPGKARTCSRACGVAYQNALRSSARQAARSAERGSCPVCGADIPEAKRAGTGYCSRECQQQAVRNRRNGSEQRQAYMRQWKYGITAEEFAAKLASQGGKCAICGTTDWLARGKGPHVDHNHDTGQIRGILCGPCNNGLGNFQDDPDLLRAAIDYLERVPV